MVGDLGSGPCMFCGATGYAPSLGGPAVCPRCDTGAFDGAALARRNVDLARRIAGLEAERDLLSDERDDFRDRLRDLVMIDGEEWATGGGPGFKERSEKAWDRAREPFEP